MNGYHMSFTLLIIINVGSWFWQNITTVKLINDEALSGLSIAASPCFYLSEVFEIIKWLYKIP